MLGLVMFLSRLTTSIIAKVQLNRDKHRRQVADMRERITGKKVNPDESSVSRVISGVLSVFVYLVATFMIIMETISLFILLSKIALILVVGVLLVVVLVSFYAMLQGLLNDEEYLKDLLNNPDLLQSNYCPRVVDGGILQWTMEELSAKGAMLSADDKSRYTYGILLRSALENEASHLLNQNGISMKDKITFAMGLTSIENGFSFGGVDILTEPAPIGLNSSGYGVLGISGNSTLSNVGFSPSAVDNIKSRYKPSRAPSYQAQYVPWGAYLSLMMQHSKMDYIHTKSADVDNKIKMVATEWGIVKSLDEFTSGVKFFLMQAQYHGAMFAEYDGYINFFAALFVLSSPDNDNNRSFESWTMEVKVGKKRTYSEGSPNRSLFIGSQLHTDIGYKLSPLEFPSINQNTALYIALNGSDIREPLWTYAYREAGKYNQSGVDKAWALLKSFTFESGGVRDRALNFHYGFNAFLQGRAVEQDLAQQMSIVGETKTQVLCTDGGIRTITPGNYVETPGKGQALIDGMSTEQFIEGYYNTLSPAKLQHMKKMQLMWGTSNYVASDINPAKKAGYRDELHGVPFYAQMKNGGESWLYEPWFYGGNNTYYATGCMIYSYAHVVSALQGVVINPAEMGSIMDAVGALSNVGVTTGMMPDLMNRFGLQAKNIEPGTSFIEFDETLDKGGLVVIRVKTGIFSTSQHFQVITGKREVDGQTLYSIYTSSSYKQSSTLYTKKQLVAEMHKGALLVWK